LRAVSREGTSCASCIDEIQKDEKRTRKGGESLYARETQEERDTQKEKEANGKRSGMTQVIQRVTKDKRDGRKAHHFP